MAYDEILKTLESWDAKSLISLAQEDEEILITLIRMLDEERFQLRVLALLEELLPPLRTNREIYKELFPRLLLLLTRNRKTAVKAARVMKVLLLQEPPPQREICGPF
ncbi:hypothetical protein [Thermococcus peptonophilus]|uniref:hypothetical protein n=1 Tax=Thermococcus peptonophilus TaxID=53952 RepID=UPI0006D2026F